MGSLPVFAKGDRGGRAGADELEALVFPRQEGESEDVLPINDALERGRGVLGGEGALDFEEGADVIRRAVEGEARSFPTTRAAEAWRDGARLPCSR